jgi:hypothetical protein
LQLLWGLRGEFTAGQQSLSSMITELQTGLSSDGGGWGANEPTATFDHGDNETAEVSKVLRSSPSGTSGLGAAFSGLFRIQSDEDAGEDEDDDVTVAAVMASAEEMLDPPTADHPDPDGVIDSSAGDTQIMQVIGQGDNRRLSPVTGPVHEQGGGGSGPVDLRRWRADHGIVTPAGMLDSPHIDGLGDIDEEGFLEEEDEDVVVMTNQAAPAAEPEPVAPRRAPISVIERFPSPPPPVPGLPAQDEDTPTVGPAPLAKEEPSGELTGLSAGQAVPILERAGAVEPRPAGSSGRLLAVTAVLVVLVASVATVMGIRSYISVQQSADIRDAVLDSDPQRLLDARYELRRVLSEDGLLSPRRANVASRLALVDVALWQHVSGSPDVLSEAHQLAAEGVGGPEAQVAIAWIDFVGGVAFDRNVVGSSPLARLLMAEAALSEGDSEAASRALSGLSGEDGARVSIALARIAQARGEDAAGVLTNEAREHPLGVLWRVRGGEPSMSEAQRLALLQAMRKALPVEAGRLRARTWVGEAEVHSQAGRAEAASAAWEEALKSDPADPILLAHVAATRRTPSGAIKLLRQCVKLLSSSPHCQRGIVQVLVESGDIKRASALVNSWSEAGIGVGLLGDWVALEQDERGVRPGAPDERDPQRSSRGLSRYLDALAQTGKGARRSGFDAAARLLAESDDLWDQRLGDHIRATHLVD